MAITGASGSGKSLLLRAIADLDPNEASIGLHAKPRSDYSPMEWRKRVVYVAAESGWWDESVAVHFPHLEQAKQWLSPMGLSDNALDWGVRRLSSGEKQRLALIRALAIEPDVLLLDEPTSALDQESARKVENVLKDFLAAGGGILIVTHDIGQADLFGQQRLHIEADRVQDVSP